MAQKTRIKLLRGTRDSIANSSAKTLPGEVLLDTTDGYLIAGLSDEANNAVNNSSHIVTTNRLVGYTKDSVSLNNSTNSNSSNRYYIGYNRSEDKFDISAPCWLRLNGNVYISPDGENINATRVGSRQIGSGSKANSSDSIAIGVLANASGTTSIAIGNETNASGNDSVGIGNSAKPGNKGAVAIGNNSISGGGVAVGDNTSASGNSSCIGKNSNAGADGSVVIGNSSQSLGYRSVAIGEGASVGALKNDSIAIGSNASAESNSLALGKNANASEGSSIALGADAIASNYSTVAIGVSTRATGNYASALGLWANASGNHATALGFNAKASEYNTVQLGDGTNSNASTLQFLDKTISNESHLFGPFVGNLSGDNVSANNATFTSLSSSNYLGLTIRNVSSETFKDSVINISSEYSVSGSIKIGYNSSAHELANGIAIGYNSSTYGRSGGGVAIGANSIARSVGDDAGSTVAIGKDAKATSMNAVQLGEGTNSNASTLQFRNTKIANDNGVVVTSRGLSSYADMDTPSSFPNTAPYGSCIYVEVRALSGSACSMIMLPSSASEMPKTFGFVGFYFSGEYSYYRVMVNCADNNGNGVKFGVSSDDSLNVTQYRYKLFN